jgi:hypothetical protein
LSEKVTYVVLGCYRGGTSLLAGLLKLMGIPMSETEVNPNNEDPEMQTDDVNIALEGILKRNNKYNIWGWKFPGSIFYMDKLLPHLRNPKFLQIYRDPYSIALSEVDRTHMEINFAIQYATVQLVCHSDFYLRNYKQYPFFLASYERIINNKETFLKDFLNFVNYDSGISYERMLEYIHPGTYEAINPP